MERIKQNASFHFCTRVLGTTHALIKAQYIKDGGAPQNERPTEKKTTGKIVNNYLGVKEVNVHKFRSLKKARAMLQFYIQYVTLLSL